MHQFFVAPEQIRDRRVEITGSDVNHIRNVLRMKPGEELAVSNGVDGKEYRCGILSFEEDRVLCELRFVKEDGPELPAQIYLFQGLPKADKMELIVQKAVELGVYAIVPVAAARSVVKLDEKKAAGRLARWQSIAEAAAKQSRRRMIPRVMPVMDFAQAAAMAGEMEARLIPYELAQGSMAQTRACIEKTRPGDRVAVMIGPEGGFAEEEIRQALSCGMTPVTLGRRILRTETAGLAVLSFFLYHLEDAVI